MILEIKYNSIRTKPEKWSENQRNSDQTLVPNQIYQRKAKDSKSRTSDYYRTYKATNTMNRSNPRKSNNRLHNWILKKQTC